MIILSDDDTRKIREAIVYASRLAHEELNQRGEADAELYEVKAAVAQKKLGEALNVIDSAILSDVRF